MGLFFYVVVNPSTPGFSGFVAGGKALVGAEERLTEAARSIGVTPLVDFLSGDPEEVAAELEVAGPDVAMFGGRSEPERWYAAEDGLTTVQALVRHVDAAVKPYPPAIRVALLELGQVLEDVRRLGLRWHLDLA